MNKIPGCLLVVVLVTVVLLAPWWVSALLFGTVASLFVIATWNIRHKLRLELADVAVTRGYLALAEKYYIKLLAGRALEPALRRLVEIRGQLAKFCR